MDVREIRQELRFNPEKMQKVNLFESPRMFCDIYCLNPGQMQKVHSHQENDKIYYVVEGQANITVGEEERLLGPGEIVCAFAGEPHGVENTSQEPLVCLVFMAPHPG